MPQAYTKEDLMALGVYELRSLAREVGVKAPTMLTKEEIANAIILVLRGIEKPQRTGFGRPVKSGGKIVEALNLLKGQQIPKEEINNPKNILNNYCSVFSNDMIIPTFAEVSFRGYVKLMQENTALVMAKGYCIDDFVHNVVITKEIFNSYTLKDGDLVECLAASIGEGKPKVVTKINSINGLHVSEVGRQREDYDSMLSFYPTKKLNLSKSFEECTNFKVHDKLLPIGFGSRVFIEVPNASKRISLACDYANAICLNNNVECVMISLGESPEDKQEIRSLVSEADLIFDDIAEENVLELLEIKINHMLRKVELGNDEVLIISDITKFKSYIKEALKLYSLNNLEANSLVGKKVLKLMNLAKNSGEDGSLTIIAFGEEKLVDVNEEICLSSINNYVKHKAGYLNNSIISLDLKNSFVHRKEKLYNNNDFIKAEKFLTDLTENTFAERFKQFIK